MMRTFAVLLALVVLALASPVLAQATASTKEALRLAYDADKLFAAGKWDEAYDGFAAAEAVAHSPVFVLYMGHCRRNAHRLHEARDLYQRVTAEKLGDDAPKPFRDAATDAARELEALRARIPSVVVIAPRGATLTIDGEPARPGEVTPLDPGKHTIEAKHAGRTVTESISLAEGAEPVEVTIAFGSAPREPTSEPKGSVVPGAVILAVGLAGLAVGAITGGIAWAMADDIKENCVDDHCLADDADALATAQRLAVVSTVGFAVGGAATVTGVVLLVVRPGGEPATAMLGVRGSF